MSTKAAAAASASTMGAAPAGGPTGLDAVGVLVYHTVVVLLALVALAVFVRIPRAFARLWRRSEWMRGHFLSYQPHPEPSQIPPTSAAPTTIDFFKAMGSSQDSHETKPAVSLWRGTTVSYPPHMKPTPSFLRPVVSVLRSSVAPGLSAAQMVVCIPFIFALGAKNNVLGTALGVGYEKLNFLHRFVARLAIISAHLRGFGYIYKWCLSKTLMEEIKASKNYFGLCMLISFDCILLTSLAVVRKRAYNVFFYSHLVAFHVLLAVNHYPQLIPYVLATVVIYGLDRLLRMVKTRFTTATIRPILQLGVTRIEIPGLNKGWWAGQHVRIQVLSSAMGFLGWAQMHPFTIASESGSQEGLVLLCKKTGTWTHKLFAAASMSQAEWGVGRECQGYHRGTLRFSTAVFVIGGSGITFALSAIQELIQQDSRGESRVRCIPDSYYTELIWIVQDASSLQPLIPQFSATIHHSTNARLTILVHYTRAVMGELRFSGLQPGVTLTPGRPRLVAAMEGTIAHAVSTASGTEVHSGLLVGVCGPVGLADDVSKAVEVVEQVKRHQIGGIEIHEE
ncbi:hypothetical protein DFH08DRAFT_1072745 [Mycena albidolilacea]|uniref:FAD-binding FR-type domain-containing protein n=1 Tax=Mycena albidolilacea TaxID=1033008 RepID=A0AAD7AP65_9AGAR|nr:hypothetical protein DFH08DRAFT_1072745 [Mycena albidolilacea]